MAGERTFLQVPPDSTGKRVRMTHTAEIFYNSLSPVGYQWDIGDRYFTTFSDNAVYSVHVHGVHQITSTTGVLEVHYAKSAKYNNLDPKVGANILDEDGVTVRAVLESFRDVYINSNHIIGYDNPEYGVDVDPTGSMNVRFSEGLPQLDAFGKLRTSGATILGDYTFSNSFLPAEFTRTYWGRGLGTNISHDAVRRTLVLTTPDTTNGLATADLETGGISELNGYGATITSNTYHHYFPGFSHMAIMTVALDNNGDKAGVAQKWGYFDDKNGYYFQARDGGGLEFVIRSSAKSGNDLYETRFSKTHTRYYINNVLDTEIVEGWNKDTVDGTGDSGKNLDLRDDNIYWLDIQWLGAGRVRFGTYHEGQRITIHEAYNDVNGGFPHSQSGSLPIRYQQYNLAGEVVASSTVMRAWCASVVTEAAVDLTTQGKGGVESFEVQFSPSNKNDYKGLNDTGKGDRTGVTKTGCSGTAGSTTLTVPNLTGIKAGFRLHIMSGTGEIDNSGSGTTILEIVNSTTVILDRPIVTSITGTDSIRFHLNVDHEYHLVGILSPVTYIGSQTTTKNRTLYLAKSSQAWAYHADGADAFCEIEIYTQPIISGNSKSITTAQSAGGPLQSVEPNDSFAGVESYEFSDGLVNYFGSGFHNQITYVKGVQATTDLSAQFANYQSGAFKILADNGGNNRCPIARVYQSPAAGEPTIIQINTAPTGVDFTLHRENESSLYFDGIPGAIGAYLNYGENGNVPFYVRHLDIEKLELWLDEDFTIPLDTSQATTGLDPSLNTGGTVNLGPAGTATVNGGLTWRGNTGSIPSGGFIISGYGDQLHFAIVAKPVGPSADTRTAAVDGEDGYATTHGDVIVHFKLTWTEIPQ